MDWQTKEYIDEKFESIEDTLVLISEKLGIDQDTEENEDSEPEEEASEEVVL